ncbi:IS4 family transposase [Sedimenticola selenatireducens]|uniref:IS4 family transposase n=1 Tax=Sedimenticola selenatireducens TaxID=191960 RepID=UPI002AAB1252|nr:IS4 family transposase [Sedimenticola selenatireducens]
MHTLSILYKLLAQSVPVHAKRLNAITAAVHALSQGATATVTSLGRHVAGDAYDKHKIKRIDRLLSNPHLFHERHAIYAAVARRLVKGLPVPIIAIDWSPLCADQSWQLLRAALPVGGRAITLYEEVHPQSKLGNRNIQHLFLDRLATIIPAPCRPIIVADSGFRTPFYRYVESTLGWHWVGRIRGRDFIRTSNETGQWLSAKSAYQKATTKAKQLGNIQWVKNNPLTAFAVLLRQSKKKRTALTYDGKKRRSKRNNVHVKREKEPWLLVASLSLRGRTPEQIVKIYCTRMQIEEGFRDCKANHYGLGQSQNRRMNDKRRSVLCLLTTLATFILWCIGVAGRQTVLAKRVRVNSSSRREPYSVVFLARLLITQKKFRLPEKTVMSSINTIKPYMESILCG